MTNNGVDDYGWSDSQGPHSCDYITPEILDIVRQRQLRKVIDVGAGNGRLCSSLSDVCDKVVGVEYDKHGVNIATQQNPQIPFYNFGVQDNPKQITEEQGLFDAVISAEVIEHLYSPHHLPIFSAPLLKDDGVLIITTPYHGYLKNLALSLLNKWDHHHTALWHGGHIKFWSKKTLSTLLTDNGFELVAFSGVGRVPFLWKSMVVVAKKQKS